MGEHRGIGGPLTVERALNKRLQQKPFMDYGVGREGEKGGLRRVTPEKYEGVERVSSRLPLPHKKTR